MTDLQKPEALTPESMDGASLDVAAMNRAQLKALFPSVFTETRNDKGELVESVDFEKLKAKLGTFTDLFESRRERYGMDWPGKKNALKLIQTPTYATLKPSREESVNFDTTENLFIEGDNLEVLKLLQKSYYGKIKMIYIDPPYNTGTDLIYPDNFAESLETYLEFAGLIDSRGRKLTTKVGEDGRFHTRWLNMMYPRLYLARNLLSDDGIIAISIDDNELTNLSSLCDEVFGEDNRVGLVSRATGTTTGQDAQKIGSSLDYLLIYRKSDRFELQGLPLDEDDEDRFTEEDSKGKYSVLQMRKTGNADRREDRPSMYYPVLSPDGKEVFPIGPNGYESRWRFGKEKYYECKENDLIVWKENRVGQMTPYVKYYLEGRTKQVSNLWDDIDGNKKGSIELRTLLEGKYFDNPKPTALIKKLLQVSSNGEGIILDFFAGSATTGQAIIDLNAESASNYKFILVQLPEKVESNTFATIAEIAKQRISKAIEAANQKFGVLQGQDRGFRVFKLNKSNVRRWGRLTSDAPVDSILQQLDLHVEHINGTAKPEDLLFELLIKSGFAPTEKIAAQKLAGIDVYSVRDGGLLICLADRVTRELIDAVAAAEPSQFVCLDSAFAGNDQLKANAVQTFAARNQGRDKVSQIVFRTV